MRKLALSLVGGVTVMLLFMVFPAHSQTPPPGPSPQPTPVFVPPPPPPCPAGVPGCPTATPTITPTPTMTPTPVPLTVSISLQHTAVNPRGKQRVKVSTLPNTAVAIVIKFPNGDRKVDNGMSDTNGSLSWTFVQPGSRITTSSRTAQVSVTAGVNPTTASAHKKYLIGFAALDVSVQPRKQKRTHPVTIWVHTSASTLVQAAVSFKNGTAPILSGRTGANGWVGIFYTVPAAAAKGAADVKATARPSGTLVRGETSFKVT